MRTGNTVAICSVERAEHTRLSVANQATHLFVVHPMCYAVRVVIPFVWKRRDPHKNLSDVWRRGDALAWTSHFEYSDEKDHRAEIHYKLLGFVFSTRDWRVRSVILKRLGKL